MQRKRNWQGRQDHVKAILLTIITMQMISNYQHYTQYYKPLILTSCQGLESEVRCKDRKFEREDEGGEKAGSISTSPVIGP